MFEEMDQGRIKTHVRRDGNRILIDVWFDSCKLQSVLVMWGHPDYVCEDVQNGRVRLNESNRLEYTDGTPYLWAKGNR